MFDGALVTFKIMIQVFCLNTNPPSSPQIAGLCGNMDGSVLDEFTSRNNMVEQLLPFAMSYSDCPSKHAQANYNQDPCNFDTAVRGAAGDGHSSGFEALFVGVVKIVHWLCWLL